MGCKRRSIFWKAFLLGGNGAMNNVKPYVINTWKSKRGIQCFYWRIKGANGRIILVSEGYKTKNARDKVLEAFLSAMKPKSFVLKEL